MNMKHRRAKQKQKKYDINTMKTVSHLLFTGSFNLKSPMIFLGDEDLEQTIML
jgi:hypothetical protein